MSATVVIIGEGVLADRVTSELSQKHKTIRQYDFSEEIIHGSKLALVLHDTWHPSIHLKAEEVFKNKGIPWLRAFVSFGEGIIGPLVRPGIPGCSQCADKRRLFAGRDRKETWKLWQSFYCNDGISFDAWASATGLLQMVHILVAETQEVLKEGRAKTDGQIILSNLITLESTNHFILPDSTCNVCSVELPADIAELARISLQTSLKLSSNNYRTRKLNDLSQVLIKEYLDDRAGFINSKMYDLVSPFANVSVNLPSLTEDEKTGGRSNNYKISELTAILEGLERYCGMAPHGKRTLVYDSFSNLKDIALNPINLGIHSNEQYRINNFPFKPFNPECRMNWVWGYSFLHENPILVPEHLAYYSTGFAHPIVFESSNGCALGGSLEEAIFYGILEVIERDSFLMTWYAKLPLSQLDPHSSNDQEMLLMLNRLREVAGFDVYLFNSTMENGVPSIWAIAKNRKLEGVNIICAAGSHLDPVKAVKGAIHELSSMIFSLNKKFKTNRQKYIGMLSNSLLVQQMEDHALLYGLPQAENRLHFLLNRNVPLRTFSEEFKYMMNNQDLTDDLKYILDIFRQLNLDVIVVNQTTPETIRNGLYCVKVFIPGMLPMTFGHQFKRLNGLDRVLNVPMKLGFTKRPLTHAELNPYPHPFP